MKFISIVTMLFSLVLISQTSKKQELLSKESFTASWKLPPEFTLERIEGLVQDMVDETHGIGFRYIGVDEDFFHGHVLFTMDRLTDEGRLFPFAVVYHTQEDAGKAHWGQGTDSKYDYLNVQTRNWLQWIDGRDGQKIYNARDYLDEKQKDKSLFFETTEPIKGQAFTIHAHNLSVEKLKYSVVGELQFEFYKSDCQESWHNDYYGRGPIKVTMPNQELVCLKLTTSVFIDWDDFGWNK